MPSGRQLCPACKTYYAQLRLDPLPLESAEELLGALLGDDGTLPPLKRLLIERTEGNPFFLEESVRTLIETHVLAGERGAYRLVMTPDTIEVPNGETPPAGRSQKNGRIGHLPGSVVAWSITNLARVPAGTG